MTSVIILLTVTIFNVVMWIVMGVKFKKIFSTEQIIEETRETLNSMLKEINRNAERNINIIDDRIKQLKAVSAEADRKLLVLKGELDKVEKSKAFVEKIQSLSVTQESSSVKSSAMKATVKTSVRTENVTSESSVQKRTGRKRAVNPIDRYIEEQAQGNLFVNGEAEEKTVPRKIPVIEPEVYMSDNPVKVEKDFNTLVRELYDSGESIEDIADKTGRSTQEVKFSLEFS